MWTQLESRFCEHLIALAVSEDLGDKNDLTSLALIDSEIQGKAALVARSAGTLSGLPVVERVFRKFSCELDQRKKDGAGISKDSLIAVVSGPLLLMFHSERIALNFLQHLSGIATLTRRFVDAVAGTKAQILDTRKTTPGWRVLEKYAVRCGGGHNHRMGLYDGILIKDNHLAAFGASPDAVGLAVAAARARHGHSIPLEIEVDTLDQLNRALDCHPDIILLDNMTLEQMSQAVKQRDAVDPEILLEASGGIALETVAAIAATGVDRVSVGALTHSAPALDIGLDYKIEKP